MKNNIRHAAQTMIAASKGDDFIEIIDHLTFEESLLVYITDEQGRVYYSSDSFNPYFRQEPKPGRKPSGGKNKIVPDKIVALFHTVRRTHIFPSLAAADSRSPGIL